MTGEEKLYAMLISGALLFFLVGIWALHLSSVRSDLQKQLDSEKAAQLRARCLADGRTAIDLDYGNNRTICIRVTPEPAR